MSKQTTPIKLQQKTSSHWEELLVFDLSPDASFCAGSGKRPDGEPVQITFWDTLSGKEVREPILTDGTHITALKFVSEDLILVGQHDGSIFLWNTSKKKASTKSVQDAHQGEISVLLPTQDGKSFYSAGLDGNIRRWSIPSLKEQKVDFPWPMGIGIHAMLLGPEDQWLAVAGEDGVIRLFDTGSFEQTREMEGHNGSVHALLMHPSEYKLISAGADRSILMWFLKGEVECEDRAEKTSHDQAILTMALTPVHKLTDGKEAGEDIPPRLVTGSEDGQIKIWPLHNKRKPKTIEVSRNPITQVHVLPCEGGSQLLSSSPNRLLQGWRLNEESELLDASLKISSRLHFLQKGVQAKEKDDRAKALKELAHYQEDPSAQSTIISVLKSDAHAPNRSQAAKILSHAERKKPIQALRDALNDGNQTVRVSVLNALRALQGEENLNPFQHALKSQHAALRKHCIKELTKLCATSPQARRMILERLHDSSYDVQVSVMDALEKLHPSTPKKPDPSPYLLVLKEGQTRLQMEALKRLYRNGWTSLPNIKSQLYRCFDHSDNSLRHLAFEIAVASVPALSENLRVHDKRLDRALEELEEVLSGKEDQEKSQKEAFQKQETAGTTVFFSRSASLCTHQQTDGHHTPFRSESCRPSRLESIWNPLATVPRFRRKHTP